MPSVPAPLFVTARSGTVPFAKLAITIPAGDVAVGSGEPVGSLNVPSKLLLPSKIETEPETVALPWFTTARSGTMSAFKSPVAMATGEVPTAIGEFVASEKLAFPLVFTSSRMVTLLEAWLTTARAAARALFALASVLFRKFAVTSATGPRSGPVDGVSVNCCCAVRGAVLESVTCAMKVKLPGVFGVPVILPVADARLNPVGNEPAATVHG